MFNLPGIGQFCEIGLTFSILRPPKPGFIHPDCFLWGWKSVDATDKTPVWLNIKETSLSAVT